MERQALRFNNRQEWRRWLQENCETFTESWLIIRKKKAEISGILYDEAVEEAICFGWIDGKMRGRDDSTFFQRFSPRRKDSPWSLINRNKAEDLIRSKQMTNAGIKKIDEAKKNGKWDAAYTSRVAPEISADLLSALESAPQAQSNFNAFSNSVRLRYTYWILDAKRPDTRQRRIHTLVERCNQNQKAGIDLRIIK